MIDTKALRQKILDMAVKGELVPQDPNDEPASVLLEKIRAEKQRLIKEGKIKKDKVDSVIFAGDDNRHYENMKALKPHNWEIIRLNEVLYYEQPTNYIVSTTDYNDTYSTPVLTAGKSFIIGYTNEKNGIYINLPCIIFDDFTTESKYVDFTFKVKSSAMKILTNNSNTNLKYLFFVMQMIDCISDLHKRFWISDFSNKFVFLPPLAEQERIVSKVEELFAEIDIIDNNQETIKTLYDELKKRTLDLAIQGKLVPQDESDEPASELLKRIRAEKKAQLGKKYVDSYIYKGDDNCYYEHIDGKAKDEAIEVPFDLPGNWSWARWGELSYSIQYGYNAPAKESGRIKMVRISDIHDNIVDWANIPFCDISEKEISTYLLKENDILFARTGGTVGKSYLVQSVPEDAIYAGYLIRTRYSGELSAQYLKYFMESPLYWVQLREGTIATAQPNCNGQTLSKMLLPIPPLNEQHRIVDKINEIFAKL